MTLEQLVERMPHLQLEDLRFLDRIDRTMKGNDVFWEMILENCNEETLTTTIAHCRRTIKDWAR